MDNESVEAHVHLVIRCAWCNRVLRDDGSWVTLAPDLVAHAAVAASVTHAICPTCFGREQPGVAYPT
jgi:hypothetical protein